MAYTNRTLEELYQAFGINEGVGVLFANIQPIVPSDWLLKSLENAQFLPLGTEKARSEAVVMPILEELMNINDRKFTIFSGYDLKVDAERGLLGETDFLVAYSKDRRTILAPIISIIEAKKHDIDSGLPQCLAQMIAAQIFNEKHGKAAPIFGCATTSDNWQFLKLDQKQFTIEAKLYFLNDLPLLLGVLQNIINETNIFTP